MSRRTQRTTKYMFSVLAQMSENFIFIYLGLNLFTQDVQVFKPLFILVATVRIMNRWGTLPHGPAKYTTHRSPPARLASVEAATCNAVAEERQQVSLVKRRKRPLTRPAYPGANDPAHSARRRRACGGRSARSGGGHGEDFTGV